MTDTAIYKAKLLQHFKHPCNKAYGDLAHLQVIKRGSNPRCGDDIEVGFNLVDDHIEQIQFRGRGCSVCIAAASMMTELVNGESIEDVRSLVSDIQHWIDGERIEIPETLEPLDAVRHHPARKQCVMLCWNALASGLEQDTA